MSFDFCKMKAKGSGALGAEEEDAAQEGVHDDESGSIAAGGRVSQKRAHCWGCP